MNHLDQIVLEGIEQIGLTDFFKKKGFSDKTITKYKLGYMPDGLINYSKYIEEDKKILSCYRYIIPDINNKKEISYLIARIEKNVAEFQLPFEIDKHYFIGANDRLIWNKKALFQKKPVFICETWTDALSVIDCGYDAIALNRIVNIVDLWKTISNLKTSKLVIFCDNDFFGKKSNLNIAKMLSSLSIKFTCVDYFPRGIKDANECMQYDRVNFEEILHEKYNELL